MNTGSSTTSAEQTVRTSSRPGMRICIVEGMAASVHSALTTGACLTGFALLLNANDVELALIASAPLLAQIFQLTGAWVLRHTGNRKRAVSWASLFSRSIWFLIATIPWFPDHLQRLSLLVFYFASNIAMNIAAPIWMSWASDLIPRRFRGRFFGKRNALLAVSSMLAAFLGSIVVDALKARGEEGLAYQGLFVVAGLVGFVCFGLLRRQPEPPFKPRPGLTVRQLFQEPLRDHSYRPTLLFLCYWSFAVGISAPFFVAQLLKYHDWTFKKIALLSIMGSLVSIMGNTFWGRVVDRYGRRPVMKITTLGIIHLPLYYAFCPSDVSWPIFMNALLAPVFWSGFSLALFSLLMPDLPSESRPPYFALNAALSGLATFVASTLSGVLAAWLGRHHLVYAGWEFTNYQVVFILSTLLRMPAFFLVSRLHDPGAKHSMVLVRQAFIEVNRWLGLGRQFVVMAGEPPDPREQ